jgi:hypothetical protein
MPTPGINGSDTRTKLIDPALHAAHWLESLTDAERQTHGEIRREQPRHCARQAIWFRRTSRCWPAQMQNGLRAKLQRRRKRSTMRCST